jgi:hypothetical protein
VSQDDFSGPEVEQRYRILQAHMAYPLVVQEHLMPEPEPELEHEPEPEPELKVDHRIELEQIDALPATVNPRPLNNNGTFHMRYRKQKEPHRAPFF